MLVKNHGERYSTSPTQKSAADRTDRRRLDRLASLGDGNRLTARAGQQAQASEADDHHRPSRRFRDSRTAATADHKVIRENGRFAVNPRRRIDIDDVVWIGSRNVRQERGVVAISEGKGHPCIDRIAGPYGPNTIGE